MWRPLIESVRLQRDITMIIPSTSLISQEEHSSNLSSALHPSFIIYVRNPVKLKARVLTRL